MREYSLTVMFFILLIIGATMLALWAFNPKNGENAELSDESSSPIIINSAEETDDGSIERSTETSEETAENSGDITVEVSENSSDSTEVITKWEYAIDISPYLKYIEPKNPEDFALLVNKSAKPLASDFVPKTLVPSLNARPGREKQCYMDATAAKALEAFIKEAAYYGYTGITVTNAYRSYDTQYYLFYDYYFKEEASRHPGLSKDQILAIVASYSFPPGQSEHQTGLCCDMHNVPVGNQENFNHTETAKWLENNAYRFGFILRYPEGKENVTGAIYESWHFRFVGRKLAAFLYENNLTLDEFYEKNYDNIFGILK